MFGRYLSLFDKTQRYLYRFVLSLMYAKKESTLRAVEAAAFIPSNNAQLQYVVIGEIYSKKNLNVRNGSMMEVSENTLIPKPLMAYKISTGGYHVFGFTIIAWFRF